MPVLLPASLSNQGFFPPPALPGLRGTTSPSATLPGPACPSRGSGWCVPHHRQGFPCCSHPPLPCVPPPIPRRDQPVRLSLTSRPVAAFPNVRAGRLPHSRFRGLLSVHSRCSPHGRWIAQGDPFHRSASNDVVTSIIRSDCYRLERQFAGRDSHPLRDGAFPRHTVRNQEAACGLVAPKNTHRPIRGSRSSTARAGDESHTVRGPVLLSGRNRCPSRYDDHSSVAISPFRQPVRSRSLTKATCSGRLDS